MIQPAAAKSGNKKGSTFVIDCAKPVEDQIMDIASLKLFLLERIKVAGGMADAFGDAVAITRDKSKVNLGGPFLQEIFTWSSGTVEVDGVTQPNTAVCCY